MWEGRGECTRPNLSFKFLLEIFRLKMENHMVVKAHFQAFKFDHRAQHETASSYRGFSRMRTSYRSSAVEATNRSERTPNRRRDNFLFFTQHTAQISDSCFPCVLWYLNSMPSLVRLPTFCNVYPNRHRRNRYCCQNRSFNLQGSERQHGRLIRLPMLNCGTAFFRTGPENRRPCYYCCSPNWTWCPQYWGRNNDLSRVAEEVWWSHQVIPEGSGRRKGCLLAQDRLESLKGWRSR